MIYFSLIARRWSVILAKSASLIGGITFLVWLLATLLAHVLAYSFALTF